jgi:hypothetical protein
MHREDKSKYLLYVEFNPKDKCEFAVEDELTTCIEQMMERAKEGSSFYSIIEDNGTFHENSGYRGCHQNLDGSKSTNKCYLLPNGMITNSLAPYYVKWYRYAIPETEKEKLKELYNFWKRG